MAALSMSVVSWVSYQRACRHGYCIFLSVEKREHHLAALVEKRRYIHGYETTTLASGAGTANLTLIFIHLSTISIQTRSSPPLPANRS